MIIRFLNIAVRSAHIAAMGVFLGGCAFRVPCERLTPSLWLTIATGVALAMLEAGPRLLWFHQGRGLMTLAKLGLLLALPVTRDHRLLIPLAVVVIGSVGSHAPARFRYYSVIHRRVIPDPTGPGGKGLREAAAEPPAAEADR